MNDIHLNGKMEYNRPLERIRSFGSGFLSGSLVSDKDAFKQFKQNISFRIDSARDMLTGKTGPEGFSPLERRQAIRERRMELVGQALDMRGEDEVSSSVRRSSGSISEDDTSNTSSSSSTSSSTPLMSEVNTGTKRRAENRGF